ncbi:MAG: DUF547 domain-containing protein, partial [Planctomycetota bacterium]|nr:DUF547 domain-containing protein [Planctomycetota bacterium]
MSRISKRLLVILAVVAVVLGVASCSVFRGEVIDVPDELPEGFPAQAFDHGSFDALLKEFVGEGDVRYSDWHRDAAAMRALDRYLGAAARFSPDNAPARFPTDDDKLAYWLNVYNACVIKGVLAHWPIESVHDVKGPIELKEGFGFFYRQRFVLGGEEINLYDLEHEIIRKRFDEPRIHFVLNCASKGCPPLRRDAVTGADLASHLLAVTVAF